MYNPKTSKKRPNLHDVLSRPAMNGGWEKLARQQDDQCDRLERLEARFQVFDRNVARVGKAAGAIAITLLGRLLYDFWAHVQIALH